ncbi:aminotransferase class IV, partial [Frankia sp. AgW1.1]|uniref:aminotransferase class IV n=1 Tax=Frankia sp. AgW1.1 TaxID=1836971 RepID=UPI0019314915
MADSVAVVWDGERAVPHDLANPLLRADDGAVLRGDGLFETLRTHDGRIFLLDEHLTRLASSASALQLGVPPAAAWRALALAATELFYAGGPSSRSDDPDETAPAGNAGQDGRLRLAATRGPVGGAPVVYALLEPVPPAVAAARATGVDAMTLSLGVTATGRRDTPWLLPGAKHLSYAVPMAAQRFAEAAGATEAVWVSVDGEVLEGTTSSIIAVVGGPGAPPPPPPPAGPPPPRMSGSTSARNRESGSSSAASRPV